MTKTILDTTSHPLFLFTPSPKHWILKSLQAATPIVHFSCWCLAVVLVFGSRVGVWQSCCLDDPHCHFCCAQIPETPDIQHFPPSTSAFSTFHHLLQHFPLSIVYFSILHFPSSTSAFSTFHHLLQHSPLSIIYFSILHFPSSPSALSTFHHLLQHSPLSIVYFSILHFPSSTSAFSTFHHLLQHLHHKAL